MDTRQGYTFLDNSTITGMYAQALGAAIVIVERMIQLCRTKRFLPQERMPTPENRSILRELGPLVVVLILRRSSTTQSTMRLPIW